jgi:hypothetical protein
MVNVGPNGEKERFSYKLMFFVGLHFVVGMGLKVRNI